jgi:hypothetical protein
MAYAKGNVTYNSVRIGDLAWVEYSYQGNPSVKIIPRAAGVRIRSTTVNGGGLNVIIVRAWVIKNSRKEFEDYIKGLKVSIGNGPSTLSSDGTSYSNCYLSKITADPGYTKFGFFTVELIQSI